MDAFEMNELMDGDKGKARIAPPAFLLVGKSFTRLIAEMSTKLAWQ